MRPSFSFLTDEQRRLIFEAASDIMEQVGVKITLPEARHLLHMAGAPSKEERVFLPRSLILSALRAVPHHLSIYRRDGSLSMQLQEWNTYYGAHTDAPEVLDPFTGERRACLEQDVHRMARLADALPQISFLTASGLIADRPAQLADRVALASCLTESTKPVLAMPLTLQSLQDMHAMAALVAGGADSLRLWPRLVIYAEPLSPLVHPDEAMRKLLYCAEHCLPVVYSSFGAQGATAPQSLPAALAQLTAESLSGLVIHQLKRPGAPFIFGGMASLMDMKTTLFSYGAPEFQSGNAMLAEMGHFLGLPNFGTAGTSDAQALDGQAMIEAFSSCLLAYLCGAHLVHDVGLLGSATWISPEMVVATAEMIDFVRHLFGEGVVSAENLSLDLFSEADQRPEFLTHPYTVQHFRDAWYSSLFYRGGARLWQAGRDPDFEMRLNRRARQLIESHQPEPLPDEILAGLWGIVEAAQP